MKRLLFITILLAALAVQAGAAGTVRLSVIDTTVIRGSTFLYAVTADSSLTGLGVMSYETSFSYDPNGFTVNGAVNAGTLTSGWGAPTLFVSGSTISVAGAGTSPLTGTGVLFYLSLSAPLPKTGWGSGFSFSRAILNEGDPATIVRNGTIWITNPPSISISPGYAAPSVGETAQYYASGGTAPYTWSTTDAAVATIDANGLVTAVHNGPFKVIARDSYGFVDTSGVMQVLAYRIVVRDTSVLQGQTFQYPVYITDLSLVNVTSGQFTLSYNQALLTPVSAITSGSILSGYGTTLMKIQPGYVSISFAGNSRLNGTGRQVLVWVKFQATTATYGWTGMTVGNLLLNEDLQGNITNAGLSVGNRSILGVSAGTYTLMAGDSVQLTATGGATPPLLWTVSDTAVASVSESGFLKALKGGVVYATVTDAINATGTSQAFNLFDTHLRLGTNINVHDSVSIPVMIDTSIIPFSSCQFTVTYDSRYFVPVLATPEIAGFTADLNITTPGTVKVAAMSAVPSHGGKLMTLWFTVDRSTPWGGYGLHLAELLLDEGYPRAIPADGSISVVEGVHDGDNMPVSFALKPGYPNPFNPSTHLGYSVAETRQVRITVNNALGEAVGTLVDRVHSPGEYNITWDAAGKPSGIYFITMRAGTFIQTRSLLLVR
jgi:hypothetical protein